MERTAPQTRKVVTVFGAGTPPPESPVYAEAQVMGRLLAEAGYAVATGGYGGVMAGISQGAAEAGGHVIGVTCERIEQYRHARKNPWVREEVRFQLLRDRMYHLITAADALVAMRGGVGTLGEVAAAWNGMQTGEIPAKPLVLVGPAWRATFDVFLAEMNGLVKPSDVGLLTFCVSPAEAVTVLRSALP